MKTKRLTFDLTVPEDAIAFANLCRSLNAACVDYGTFAISGIATVEISNGY